MSFSWYTIRTMVAIFLSLLLVSQSITTGDATAKSSSTTIIQGSGTVSGNDVSAVSNSSPGEDAYAETSVTMEISGDEKRIVTISITEPPVTKKLEVTPDRSLDSDLEDPDSIGAGKGFIQRILNRLRSMLQSLF